MCWCCDKNLQRQSWEVCRCRYKIQRCCPIKMMGSKKCWIEVCFVFEHLPWLTTFQNNDEGIDVTKQVDDLDDFLGDPHIVTRIILRTKTWSVNHNYSSIGVSSPNSLSKSTIWWIIYLYLLQTKIFAESAFSDWWTHRLCNGVWLSPECRRQGASFGLIAHVKICFVFSWRVEDKVEKSWLAFPRLSYGSDHQLVIRLWWKLHHSASLGHLLQRFLLKLIFYSRLYELYWSIPGLYAIEARHKGEVILVNVSSIWIVRRAEIRCWNILSAAPTLDHNWQQESRSFSACFPTFYNIFRQHFIIYQATIAFILDAAQNISSLSIILNRHFIFPAHYHFILSFAPQLLQFSGGRKLDKTGSNWIYSLCCHKMSLMGERVDFDGQKCRNKWCKNNMQVSRILFA